jgi:ankyrin repeat protein
MAGHHLPERPSLEYLKKLAKERLRELRESDPSARLSEAQLAVARDHGFASWRAMKKEVERSRGRGLSDFLQACREGDLEALRDFLARDPDWVHERDEGGATCLHLAVAHPDALRLLLEHGADPHARDRSDNALPLHLAAGGGPLASVRVLIDAGSDVQGSGDDHNMDVIGWATCFAEARRDVVALLVERGARHHVFSAIAMGDPDLIRQVVRDDPKALARRLSHNEQFQSAVHYVIAPADGLIGGLFRTGDHYRMLDVLIELGADLDATDAKGRTPLAVAMLRGDHEAMRRLHAAGAKQPEPPVGTPAPRPSSLASAIGKISPMMEVGDMTATIEWYREVGFELRGSHEDGDGRLGWASVTFGEAEIMFVPGGDPARLKASGVGFWIRTSRIDDLYDLLKRRQLECARATLAGESPGTPELSFSADLYTAFYGQREFGMRDPNGIELMFYQPLERPADG